MNDDERKTCPLCCEPVHPSAKKCPHCLHYLNKWTLIAFHPLVGMVPAILAMIAFGVFFESLFDQGESFAPHRSEVHVTDSQMQFGETKNGPTVAVVGTIQNESDVAWKSVTLEVQFFDKSHKLIDSKQSKSWSDDLTLPSKSNCAFKISQPREFNPDDYASYEVRIVDARDRHGFLQ